MRSVANLRFRSDQPVAGMPRPWGIDGARTGRPCYWLLYAQDSWTSHWGCFIAGRTQILGGSRLRKFPQRTQHEKGRDAACEDSHRDDNVSATLTEFRQFRITDLRLRRVRCGPPFKPRLPAEQEHNEAEGKYSGNDRGAACPVVTLDTLPVSVLFAVEPPAAYAGAGRGGIAIGATISGRHSSSPAAVIKRWPQRRTISSC